MRLEVGALRSRLSSVLGCILYTLVMVRNPQSSIGSYCKAPTLTYQPDVLVGLRF